LNAEYARLTEEAGAEIARLQAEAAERTLWAQRLDTEIAGYREELRRIWGSRWFRAGKALGLGPQVRDIK
jgi:hypothetical protein